MNSQKLKVALPKASESVMLSKALDVASSKGIPVELLNRDYLLINNYKDADLPNDVLFRDIPISNPLYSFIISARFSLPDALSSKLNFLSSKKYASNVKDFESYLYFAIQTLYYREPQYEFLPSELDKIKSDILKTGTFYSKNCDFKIALTKKGTFSEHLVACSFMLFEEGKIKLDLKAIMDIINIIIHLPIVSQFAARNPYIEEPSMSFMDEWDNFILAAKEMITVVYDLYYKLDEDYWKTYYFFVNNDIIEISKILSFSEIDAEAVDNWVALPKAFTGDSKSMISVDNINYLKWS